MTKPQLYVLREGLFVPAKVLEKDEKCPVTVDLCLDNFVEPVEEVNPLTLRELLQVATKYLGGMKFVREEPTTSSLTSNLVYHKNLRTTYCGSGLEMIKRLVQMGEQAATRAGVSHFTIETSVTPVESVPTAVGHFSLDNLYDNIVSGRKDKERTDCDKMSALCEDPTFIQKAMFGDSKKGEKYFSKRDLIEPTTKEVEYILHPTLNLYVPR